MRRKRLGLRRVAGLATFIAAVGVWLFVVPSAFAASTGCPSLSGKMASPDISASVAPDGTGTVDTYTVSSPTGSTSSGGVPGLIKYCVFTSPMPDSATTTGASFPLWQTAIDTDNFAFGRNDGNPSNIPFDGNTYTVGTATWSGGAPDASNQTILLHINDPAECQALYGDGNLSTCWVLPSGQTGCTENCGPGTAQDLTVTKDAAGAYTRTYAWTVNKSVDKNRVDALSGNVTFNYTVTASYDSGTVSGVTVSGLIQISNPNNDPVTIDSISDQLSGGATTTCAVTNGTGTSIPSGQTPASGAGAITYSCDLGSTLPTQPVFNTVTVTWSNQTLEPSGDGLDGNSASFTYPTDPSGDGVPFTATLKDNCATVKDTFNGGSPDTLGTVCTGNVPAATNLNLSSLSNFSESFDGTNTFTFKYSRSVPVVADQCVHYLNKASATTNTTTTTSYSSQVDVQVCGPAAGGLTMGFWQNKNGQGIILNNSGTNCQTLATWLKQFHPFSDLTATTCGTSPSLTGKSTTAPSGVVGYVYTVIKAATCTSTSKTCNSMLKAQMLATALNVYFSDPTLGGDKIALFNGGNTVSLGGVKVDLTKICAMIDGTGGTATCSGTYENVSAEFGGATCLSVINMLLYQNTSDPAVDAGAYWYQQIKAQQVLAKDAFDATNNQVSFTC
jgi:hypothetical protein